jgi:hypothetical protein
LGPSWSVTLALTGWAGLSWFMKGAPALSTARTVTSMVSPGAPSSPGRRSMTGAEAALFGAPSTSTSR